MRTAAIKPFASGQRIEGPSASPAAAHGKKRGVTGQAVVSCHYPGGGNHGFKFEDVAKPETLLVWAALALTWRFVFPVVGTILRPAAKAVIKGEIMPPIGCNHRG